MSRIKIIWRLLGILGLVFVIIFLLLQPSNNEICIQKYEAEKSKIYHGIVTEKFIDYEEHNFKTILLNNNQKILMNWDFSGLYEFLQPNDSIVKDTGSYEVTVYRDSAEYKFVIDYGCDDLKEKFENK